MPITPDTMTKAELLKLVTELSSAKQGKTVRQQWTCPLCRKTIAKSHKDRHIRESHPDSAPDQSGDFRSSDFTTRNSILDTYLDAITDAATNGTSHTRSRFDRPSLGIAYMSGLEKHLKVSTSYPPNQISTVQRVLGRFLHLSHQKLLVSLPSDPISPLKTLLNQDTFWSFVDTCILDGQLWESYVAECQDCKMRASTIRNQLDYLKIVLRFRKFAKSNKSRIWQFEKFGLFASQLRRTWNTKASNETRIDNDLSNSQDWIPWPEFVQSVREDYNQGTTT